MLEDTLMSATSAKIAVYVSNHGLGHLVRTGAVCAALAERMPLRYTVISLGPPALWPPSIADRSTWRRWAADPGVVQSNGIDIDVAASEVAVRAWQEAFAGSVESECAWLRSGDFDLVFGDVPAVAFAAAAQAGLPSVALANFSWDWIYRRMGFEQAADLAARAYGKADLLLELRPGPPMEAFVTKRSLGLLGRRAGSDRHRLRSRLGVEPGQRLVLIAMPQSSRGAVQLPQPSCDVVYLLDGDPSARSDVLSLPLRFPFADAVAAADAVVAKPGYGTIGDTAANGTSLLWTRRYGFPEDPFLESWIRDHLVSAEIERERLRQGLWGDELATLLGRERAAPDPAPALQAACEELVARVGG